MAPPNRKRKRFVAACSQCYLKKQKCDHQYPCGNCVRRRLPELCSYTGIAPRPPSPSPGSVPAGASGSDHARESRPMPNGNGSSEEMGATARAFEDNWTWPALEVEPALPYDENLPSDLGYFEISRSNLLGLMEKFDLLGTHDVKKQPAQGRCHRVMLEIRAALHHFPKKSVIDRLIQNFFKEVNWIYEMIHPTAFLTRYEKWWKSEPASNRENLDFAVLILRMCAYSAQFIPSKSHPQDTILNIPINRIRTHCDRLGTQLFRLCEHLEDPRSLFCIQHLFFDVCYVKNEGSMRDAWYVLGTAIRFAKHLEIHLEDSGSRPPVVNALEQDIRRRVFWNLCIWDRFLSVLLDRSPFISDECYCRVELPKMRFPAASIPSPDAPDPFTERVLQAKLSKLWTSMRRPTNTYMYEPFSIEDIYARLNQEFIAQLPAAFDVYDPDLQWDGQLPGLTKQRETIRMAVFGTLTQLFQPLLHVNQDQVEAMDPGERDLLCKHREHLARAAMSTLESVSRLHELMGGYPIRFFMIAFFSYEPAIILAMYLISRDSIDKALAQAHTAGRLNGESNPSAPPAGQSTTAKSSLTASHCRRHIESALERLSLLQDASMIAKVGIQKVKDAIAKLDALSSDVVQSPTSAPGLSIDNGNSNANESSGSLDLEVHEREFPDSGIQPVDPLIPNSEARFMESGRIDPTLDAFDWPAGMIDDTPLHGGLDFTLDGAEAGFDAGNAGSLDFHLDSLTPMGGLPTDNHDLAAWPNILDAQWDELAFSS